MIRLLLLHDLREDIFTIQRREFFLTFCVVAKRRKIFQMQLRKQLLDIIINYLKLMIQCYSRQEYPSFNTIYCSAITSLKSPAYTCKRLLQLLPICTSHDDLIPTPAIRQYLGVNLKLAASQVRLAWSFELVLL